MNTTLGKLMIMAALPALGGCDELEPNGAANYASFAEISVDAVAMQDKYVDVDGDLLPGLTPADAADIPTTGTGTYSGFVSGDVDGSQLIGQLTMDANFATNAVDSEAWNFIHETDGAYAGTLAGSGIVARTPPPGGSQVTSNLTGTLTNGGTDYVTSLTLEGDLLLYGLSPVGAIAGETEGFVGSDTFDGRFAAER